MAIILLGVVLSYLIGSFPTAVIVSKLFFGFDIRTRGSGNMGSTNAFRQLGVFWGIVVQLVDILKGYAPTFFISKFVVNNLGNDITFSLGGEFTFMLLFGFCAVAGHIWSIFVGFKGGKGINTALGMLLAITPLEVGICLVVFLLAFISSGYVSLGSLLASLTYPIVIAIRGLVFGHKYLNFTGLLIFSILLLSLIVFTHRSNIKRIVQGTENKFEKFHIIKFKRK
ncbi:MAG: Acyl-phosphate:glycerol-3-phosphate O-acyltransferase PlsY (EC 2.3.1.n3) [Candidatus Kapaibacterium sp.]|nr:MAG: Acyl-phosphate:glycerol-3-phosphate O-acyltransferase PlsY (EC 2.3.1.n3) [Candidatus Kapabacteria bacterium]